jgi:ubiquitin C
MLLESEVAEAVHAALGVAVPHSLRDATRLSDADKTARRGNALALFARRGWAPSPEFWREAHGGGGGGGGGGGAFQQPTSEGSARAVMHSAPGADLPLADGAQEPPFMCAPPPPPTKAELRAERKRATRRGQRVARLLERGGGIMQILLKTFSGRTATILAEPAMTVMDLKLEVYDLEGIPPDDQRLIFAGRRLEDERMLADYYIKTDATICLAQRLRGC